MTPINTSVLATVRQCSAERQPISDGSAILVRLLYSLKAG